MKAQDRKVYKNINTGEILGNEIWLGCNDSEDNYVEVDKPVPIDTELGKAKEKKIAEISKACEQTIFNGVDIGGEHFSLTYNDQINLSSVFEMIKQGMATALYHADGELCRPFTADEVNNLMTKATEFKTYHTTYCNHLFSWINRLETVEEVNSITYGSELPEDLQEHLNGVLEIE